MAWLSPLQRGYLMALRRAKVKAQRERDELAERFEDALGAIRTEMRSVRSEFARLQMIDHALLAERDEHEWLN
jgi:hypothetical protein